MTIRGTNTHVFAVGDWGGLAGTLPHNSRSVLGKCFSRNGAVEFGIPCGRFQRRCRWKVICYNLMGSFFSDPLTEPRSAADLQKAPPTQVESG